MIDPNSDRVVTTRPALEPATGWRRKSATDYEMDPHGRTAGTELFLGHE